MPPVLYEVGTGKPYATIMGAIAAAISDYGSTPFTTPITIKIYAGTYNEDIAYGTLQPTNTNRLFIQANTGDTIIINCATDGGHYFGSDYTEFIGLKFYSSKNILLRQASGAHYYYRNCLFNFTGAFVGFYLNYWSGWAYFYNCDISGTWIFYSNVFDPALMYFNSCYIHDIGSSHFNFLPTQTEYCHFKNNGVGLGGGSGTPGRGFARYNICEIQYPFGLGGGHDVYDNIFIAGGGPIYLNWGNDLKVYNNTFFNCEFYAYYLPGVIFKNNIIYYQGGNMFWITQSALANLSADYNDWYIPGSWGYFEGLPIIDFASWKSITGNDAHGISADPLFELPGSLNAAGYRLKAGSPCLNIGLDLSAIFTKDYYNKHRYAWDLGAIDYSSGLEITSVTKNKTTMTTIDFIICEATVTGYPEAVYFIINGRAFPAALVSGTLYRATIQGDQIGPVAAGTVQATATNQNTGDLMSAASTLTVTFPVLGRYDIAGIETGINAILAAIPELKTVLKYEPKQIPDLPGATLFFDGFDQEQTEAVDYTITYKWILRIYVKLHDAEDAQTELKLMVSKVLAALKDQKRFFDTVLFGTAPSGVTSAILDRNAPLLMEEITLTALKEEK